LFLLSEDSEDSEDSSKQTLSFVSHKSIILTLFH